MAGVRIRRKSCVFSCSMPGMIFFPSTPTTFTAMPRTSPVRSCWRLPSPFEKRT
jgi:hypothetical protein